MLRPVLTIALLVRCVDIARLFDIIYTTTQGGPGTATQNASLLAYNNTFQFYESGYGAAMAIALGVIMFPVYFAYLRLTRI
jgi:multiple sugar transport system permease protein